MQINIRYGQRQTEWKDINLGTTTHTTIGSHGCTITCIGMIADLTPKEVNELFVKHGVYSNGNLVNWTKINSAIPWVHFEENGRHYSYDNVKALDAISRHGFVMAEVNAAPIGSPSGRHWVLMTGNKRLNDPWDGQDKPTSTYKFTGLAILHSDGKPQPPADPTIALKAEIEALKLELSTAQKFYSDSLAIEKAECLAKIASMKDSIVKYIGGL